MIQKTRKVKDSGIEQEMRQAEKSARFVQLEVRDDDPQDPSNGLAWVRRVGGGVVQLRVRVDGVTRSATLT